MAATTSIARSVLPSGIIVSTVRCGRGGRYETAYIVDGIVSDSEVTSSPAEARYVHDAACDVANHPSTLDQGNLRAGRLARLLAGAKADREATRGIGPSDLAPVLASARVARLG